VALLWRQPLVTFPPSPFHPPIPERATRTIRLQRRVKKRIRNCPPRVSPGPLSYTRFQAVPINIYRPILLCVASCNHEAPCQREFLVRSWRDNVLQMSLMSTRSPGAIADLRADMYRTDPQGPGRFQTGQWFNLSDSTILRRCDFLPSFGGESPQMSPPSRSCPEMAFPVLQAVSCLSPPILGANERLMP
jgi:hypothetical protein